MEGGGAGMRRSVCEVCVIDNAMGNVDDSPSICTLSTDFSSSACMSVVVRLNASVTSLVFVCRASSSLDVSIMHTLRADASISASPEKGKCRTDLVDFVLGDVADTPTPVGSVSPALEARSSCRLVRAPEAIARFEATRA